MWIRFHMGVVPLHYRCTTVSTWEHYRCTTVASRLVHRRTTVRSPSQCRGDSGKRIPRSSLFAHWTPEPKDENIQQPTSNIQCPLVPQSLDVGRSMLVVGCFQGSWRGRGYGNDGFGLRSQPRGFNARHKLLFGKSGERDGTLLSTIHRHEPRSGSSRSQCCGEHASEAWKSEIRNKTQNQRPKSKTAPNRAVSGFLPFSPF